MMFIVLYVRALLYSSDMTGYGRTLAPEALG
jgi:hypothetical protein